MSYLYGNRTVTDISMELSGVIDELEVVNRTLNSITFNESSVNELQRILDQVRMTTVHGSVCCETSPAGFTGSWQLLIINIFFSLAVLLP